MNWARRFWAWLLTNSAPAGEPLCLAPASEPPKRKRKWPETEPAVLIAAAEGNGAWARTQAIVAKLRREAAECREDGKRYASARLERLAIEIERGEL